MMTFITNPKIRKVLSKFYRGYLHFMATHLPDKQYLIWRHWHLFHTPIHIDHPKLFNEKLHWLKLNDRKEIYHTMVDKYDVKSFVAQKYSPKIVIPTLGVWNAFDDIDFSQLPDSFILKGTFDSGSYYICKNKDTFDQEKAKKSLTMNWNDNYYIWSREWPYNGLKHRIIAEPLLTTNKEDLWEFKFFCFEGEPRFYQSCLDREKAQASLRFYDINGNEMDIRDKYHIKNTDNREVHPQNLKEMIDICKKFAKGTHFLRVDLYEIKGKIYFGEFTFYENGGWCEFLPKKYNKILGDWIQINDK